MLLVLLDIRSVDEPCRLGETRTGITLLEADRRGDLRTPPFLRCVSDSPNQRHRCAANGTGLCKSLAFRLEGRIVSLQLRLTAIVSVLLAALRRSQDGCAGRPAFFDERNKTLRSTVAPPVDSFATCKLYVRYVCEPSHPSAELKDSTAVASHVCFCSLNVCFYVIGI